MFFLVILDDRCKEKPQKSYPKAASEDTGLEKSNQSHFLAQVIPMVITMAGLWLVYGWFMAGLWLVYGWFMAGLWLVYGWYVYVYYYFLMMMAVFHIPSGELSHSNGKIHHFS